DDAVIARGNHVRALAKDGDELVHVVIVGREDRQTGNLFGDGAASDGVEALHGGEDGEDAMFLREGARRGDKRVEVVLEFAIDFSAGLVEVDRTVLAIFVGAGGNACDVLCNRSFYRPDEWMNRAKDEDGSFFVPACLA